MNSLKVVNQANGIVDIIMDMPDEKINKFCASFIDDFHNVLSFLEERNEVKLIRFLSAKKNIFIAGADIAEIASIKDSTEAALKAKSGQDLFNRIENLEATTLSIINGACLGGGLEFALSCDFRMSTSHHSVKLGLPEVNLGILPGFGGTVRLPKLVGIQSALELILSGKALDGKRAFKKKLVDFCVAPEYLEKRIEEFSNKLLSEPGKRKISGRREKNFSQSLLEDNPLGRKVLFDKVKTELLSKTGGHYPAPLLALETVQKNFQIDLAKAYKNEREAFGKLAPNTICKNLIEIYYTSERLKKEYTSVEFEPIEHSAVIGAGIMGGGISWLMSYKDIDVRMKDISLEAIQKGYEAAHDIYAGFIKRRRLTKTEVGLKMNKITSTVNYSGFKNIDFVVEAVVENMEVKKKVLAQTEKELGNGILVSNTSSLSIGEMASSLADSKRFLGMHFFNPVNRMPLVEIIPHKGTSEESITKTIALTRRLGKIPIVVKDVPGFLVNRVLIPYMNEAMRCLEETHFYNDLNGALKEFGWPMGPFTLADEVGFDVGQKVADILEDSYGQRMEAPTLLGHLIDNGFLGKKNGKGFYHRDSSGDFRPNDLTAELEDFKNKKGLEIEKMELDQQVERCIYQFINESIRCIEEGVVSDASYLDHAMILGTGFPPFRGGPLRYADEIGLEKVLEKLNQLEKVYGLRFKAPELLKSMIHQQLTFYKSK